MSYLVESPCFTLRPMESQSLCFLAFWLAVSKRFRCFSDSEIRAVAGHHLYLPKMNDVIVIAVLLAAVPALKLPYNTAMSAPTKVPLHPHLQCIYNPALVVFDNRER